LIDPSSIENLKNQLDIVDVIGNYIELQRAGANYKAICPFHDEKTPSFVVSPSKQIYHCFGCGASGDTIQFVMEYEKLSYPEAIEKLAREYNFTLSYTKNTQNSILDEKRVLENIQQWFFKNLTTKQIDYLKQRGISDASIEKFGIGYAPTNQEVMSFLKQNFIPLPTAHALGLVAQDESGNFYSRFIERITFPIFSVNGMIIGFGGRTVTNHPAKYINSPQTKLFNKSRVLYGYHLAKQNIYTKKELILTEGYIDVVMFFQAGFDTAVATLGTALTREHLPLLKKGDPRVILAYDGDSAGVEAALKASKMLLLSNFEGGVVLFPEGKDPADMIAQNQKEEVARMLRNPKPFFEFIVDETIAKYNLTNPKQKENAFKEIHSFLNSLSEIAKDAFLPYAASALGVRASLFNNKNQNNAIVALTKTKNDITELSIIKTVLENKHLLDTVLDVCSPLMFTAHSQEMQELCRENFSHPLLMKIDIDDSIVALSYEELKSSLLIILIKYYTSLLQQLPKKDMEFDKKSKMLRKIKTKILPRLRAGELVSFEEIDTI